MIDSGAAGEAFIHSKFLPAINIQEIFQRQLLRIKYGGVSVSGFNNKRTDTIQDVFRMDLLIAGRRVPTWFLMCDTGRHDLLLGRIWLAKNRALVDCEDRKIRWKEEEPMDQITGVPAGLTVPASEIARCQRPQINDDHQRDADRRDALMEQQIRSGQVSILRRPESTPSVPNPENQQTQSSFHRTHVHRTHASDLRESYHRMSKELKGETKPQSTDRHRQPNHKELNQAAQAADIAFVGADGFILNTKRKDIVIGATSLYEVNKLIEEQNDTLQETKEHEQLLDERLPSHLQAYRDVFQKVKADELPPHREGVDYDIQLESENILSTKPLYSVSIEHLKLMKEYLEEHLRKGFIVPSEAPFASPVLFAEKPGGGWRFCVDYRRLNEITKKDRYPVPLIEETLARLSKARVFTKLDVRHAFNRIRLKESIEDLTTFRT